MEKIRIIKRMVRRLENYWKRVEHRNSADEKLPLEFWELKSVFPLMALAQKVCVCWEKLATYISWRDTKEIKSIRQEELDGVNSV